MNEKLRKRFRALPLLVVMLAILLLPAFADGNDSAIPPEVASYANDWPLPNHDYDNHRAATNSSINSGNVNELGLAWAFKIPGIGRYGGAASNPIILRNTAYFQDLRGNIVALDLQSGETRWEAEYNSSAVEGPNGPAVGWGKVFAAKDIHNMTALNSSTGEEIWTTRISNITTTGIDIQPQVYDGMVYISTVPGTSDIFYAPGGIGVIYALDQATGQVLWNFSTVDSPDLWGHAEINSGGGCWYTPSIDLKTGTIYWGISNPAPFPGTDQWPSGTSRPGPNLYTDSMMALNHTTGSMLWFNQVYPHDLFDYDLQIAPILANGTVSGRHEEMVIGAGKMGRVYAFNRNNGYLLWVTDVGEHNENYMLDMLPNGTTRTQPAVIGGVETPMAYADGVLYVPVIDMVTDWTPSSLNASSLNFSTGKGELVAINVSGGKILWYKKFDSINIGAATVVNDLVFTATYDGNIYALNRTTGDRIWKYKAPAGINGWPAVAGDTILWPCGVGANPSLIALKIGAKGGSPQISITSPKDGSTMASTEVNVSVQVMNFNLTDKLGAANVTGEGHIHYFKDVQVPTSPGLPAITEAGTYAPTPNTSYTWMNLSPGLHTFSVELVNNDHTPLFPPVTDTVNATIESHPPVPAAVTIIGLVAKNMAFNTTTITVPAGAEITVNFDNQDSGIPHNFAVYQDKTAATQIFKGDITVGPRMITYTFTAPTEPGSYFFRCDVHPNTMTGNLIVE
jgi:outer membrane protein assembly factor BamB/plastocyanin